MNVTERLPAGRTGVRVTGLGLGPAPIGGLYAPVGEQPPRATVEDGVAVAAVEIPDRLWVDLRAEGLRS